MPTRSPGGLLALDEVKADTAKDRLAERASDTLRATDMLWIVQSPQNTRLNLDQSLSSVRSASHIPVGKL